MKTVMKLTARDKSLSLTGEHNSDGRLTRPLIIQGDAFLKRAYESTKDDVPLEAFGYEVPLPAQEHLQGHEVALRLVAKEYGGKVTMTPPRSFVSEGDEGTVY
jgi:hypothetical protein